MKTNKHILYFLYCMGLFLTPLSHSLKSMHCYAQYQTVTEVIFLPSCSVCYRKSLSSSFSTSHFLMPILQENFPFVQKSSRTLVRYSRVASHHAGLTLGGCDYWTASHIRGFWWMKACWWPSRKRQRHQETDGGSSKEFHLWVDWTHCAQFGCRWSGKQDLLICIINTVERCGLIVCRSLQECYVHNLLRVTVYIPSLRRDILEAIIGKMLKLDVSGSTQLIQSASLSEKMWEKGGFYI